MAGKDWAGRTVYTVEEQRAYHRRADLLEALRECLPDLEHYVSTHGPGPDRRLDRLRGALAAFEGGEA